METIGDRILEFASKIDKGKTELAVALGMSYPHLYKYVSNKSMPGADILIRFRELGCDINWLLTGEEPLKIHEAKEPAYIYTAGGHPIPVKALLRKIQIEKELVEIENKRLLKTIELLNVKLELANEYIPESVKENFFYKAQ